MHASLILLPFSLSSPGRNLPLFCLFEVQSEDVHMCVWCCIWLSLVIRGKKWRKESRQ
ncbi:hypothetical protein MtrunA17_Chr5g0416451 [Medicago truncatula]|uniref:Uncharacterized protein n=1 Tax=Medicago truncatula TaxID=3880 RepID=A0A396HTN9_MEDTR|nr:hypothetical protein MtrunA17_Chr5g0416451 [Medicago truncatula]